MKNYITFAGMDSTEFNIGISGSGTFDSPERDVEQVSIPGRNGDLLIDNKRFKNVTVTYPAFIASKFKGNFDGFRAFMLSKRGYQRLEDTYHPDEFRMAEYRGPIKPDVKVLNIAGEFNVEFNCKPQRWLKVGEIAIDLTASGVINNPTLYEAKPLIRAYGTGTIAIGDNSITVTTASVYTDIDCEIMEAYKDGTDCNSNITLGSDEFPSLEPGDNTITISGFSNVSIIPRWWTI